MPPRIRAGEGSPLYVKQRRREILRSAQNDRYGNSISEVFPSHLLPTVMQKTSF